MKRLAARVALVFFAFAALPACAEHAAVGSGEIAGRVKLGPIMPVCREGVPCDGVYRGATVVVMRQGGSIEARATSDDNGDYRVMVPAGSYAVRIDVQGPMPSCSTADVVVAAGQSSRADIECDSGIR